MEVQPAGNAGSELQPSGNAGPELERQGNAGLGVVGDTKLPLR